MSSFELIDMSHTKYNIEIWIEKFGRKKNTLISGWGVELSELKKHINNIKKKKGCNGTIRKDGTFLLQGDHVNYMYDYLLENSITSDEINIKSA